MDATSYERALLRARAEGVEITGASVERDGARAWTVVNPAHDGAYTVRLAAGANVLTCNCPARVPCKHRALVHAALAAERAEMDALVRGLGSYDESARITVGTLRMARRSA